MQTASECALRGRFVKRPYGITRKFMIKKKIRGAGRSGSLLYLLFYSREIM